MTRSFDLDEYNSLVNAEQRAHRDYLGACEAMSADQSVGGPIEPAVRRRLQQAEQVWHEAHFNRIAYEA